MKLFLCLAALATLLYTSACSSCRAVHPGAKVDSNLAALTPSNTQAALAVDIDALKATNIAQRHRSEWDVPLLDGAVQRIGLDPQRDISKAMLLVINNELVLLARGSFSPENVTRKLTDSGARQTSYSGVQMFTTGEQALCVLNGAVVAGSSDAVKAVIDTHGHGDIPDALDQRLRKLAAGDQIWAVSSTGIPAARLPKTNDVFAAASSLAAFVNGGSLGIAASTGVNLEMELNCVSDTGAQQVRDALRGIIALGRLSTRDGDTAQLKLYDAFQVSQQAANVRITADLPPQLSDQLIALVHHHPAL